MAVLPVYDPVCVLIQKPFAVWNEDDKKDFLKSEKPTPHLDVNKATKCNDKVFIRKFKSLWYSQYDWLCGSYYLKKLFCLPCLIMSTKSGVWNTSGFGDFGNVSRSLHKHESCGEHLRCAFSFKQLKRILTIIQDDLEENSRLYIKKFNENVLLNRRFMELPIRAIVFLAKQELAFSGDHEHVICENRGNFKELLETLVDISPTDIKEQYKKNSSVFSCNLGTIQNELIDCISGYIDEHVEKEIKECNFLSIQVDDITDLCQKSQCSIIFRFVVSGGKVKERFLGFHDANSDRTANTFFNIVLNYLEKYDCKSKLVGQCYDGACVVAGHLYGLQAKVKEVAPQAVFIHSSAHSLNLVLEQSCNNILKCRIFFASVSELSSFFQYSAKRIPISDSAVGKWITTAVVTRWTSNSEIINVINNEWKSMKEMFIQIITNQSFDQTSVRQSSSFLKEFNDFEFALLVVIFSDIFVLTDVLFDILQKNPFDISYCILHITNTQKLIEQKRNLNNFRRIFDLAMSRVAVPTVHLEGGTIVSLTENEVFQNYEVLFYEIVDTVSEQITSRFADINKIKFVSLMDTSKFTTFSENFPTDDLNFLKEYYPHIFNDVQLQRLKSELQLLYTQYEDSEPSSLMKRLHADRDIFKETYKLFSLILTIPSTSVSTERSFSCLERIKAYLHNTVTYEERLLNLAKMSIEKGLLDELIATRPFYDDIINKFSSLNLKDMIMDLVFKKYDVSECT